MDTALAFCWLCRRRLPGKAIIPCQATWIACGSVALSFALSVIVAAGQFTGGYRFNKIYTLIQSGQFNL